MDALENKPLPPPPGVIDAIKSGMDVIANHLGVLFLPLALDLGLWLASRLSVKELFLGEYVKLMDFYVKTGMLTNVQIENMQSMREPLETIFLRFNLLSLLRSFPVGVTSLMQSKMPIVTPYSSNMPMDVNSWGEFWGWTILFMVLGWILGGLYFNSVSTLVEKRADDHFWRVLFQAILFNIGFMILAVIIGTPIMLVLASLSTLGVSLMQVAFFAIAMVGSWFVVPVFFAPHGIFLRGQDVLRSIAASLKMARFTLPTSSMFVLTIFLMGQGLNYLWSVPSDDSWMLLVGVIGHAFITTSLLAASFIYYRDMNAWLEIALERMKAAASRQAL